MQCTYTNYIGIESVFTCRVNHERSRAYFQLKMAPKKKVAITMTSEITKKNSVCSYSFLSLKKCLETIKIELTKKFIVEQGRPFDSIQWEGGMWTFFSSTLSLFIES